MSPNLLQQGLTLMLVGMGTVFVFLTILVAGMSAMAAIVKRFLPSAMPADISDEEVAAITAALNQHRAARR
ncbi:MAG: OadG family protein [Gammaproteobacteria bacterium]|nr:OadG family protein [Gammaproteobacteria bacterium]MBT8104527.1 OadG family protein [Gammaproteobacteria bacterium]NNK24541.1 OadG family protein [Woeseiaceae bacterium]